MTSSKPSVNTTFHSSSFILHPSSFIPLWRTSARRMVRRPLQYLLFLVGVAIGVAMMVAIDLANSSARRAFSLSTDAITGRATHRLIGGPAGLDEQLYFTLRRELGFELSAPVVEGYVTIPELGGRPLRLMGVDPLAEPPFRSYLQPALGEEAAGRLFLLLTQPNTIIVSADLAQSYGVTAEQTITIDVAGQQTAVFVLDLLIPADQQSRSALDNLLFTDISTAQELLNMPGRVSYIDLIASDESQLEPIEALLPAGVRLENSAAASNTIQQMTAAFELNLTALSLLALIVGMFLIYNTVTFSVVQRRPLFGILRCLGVTGEQLFVLILSEAIALSLVGSLIGLGLGVALGRGLVGLITQTINDFYFVVNVREVIIDPLSLLRGVAFGVLAALLASLVPALEAWRTPPNSSLRRSVLESKVVRLLPYLVAGWAVLGVMGLLFLRLPGGIIPAFAGLFAILFAFALLTPPVTVWSMNLLAPAAGKLLGVIGRMATRDIVRSLSRTSVAIAALMTAVSVIVGVSIMIGSFRQTVVLWLNDTLQADIYISPPALTASRVEGEIDPAVVEQLLAWPRVLRGSTARTTDVLVTTIGREVQLVAVSGDVADGQRPYVWLSTPTEPEAVAKMLNGEGVIISEPLLLKEGLTLPPPPLTFATNEGEITLPVVAVFYDYSTDQGLIWMGKEKYSALWGDTAVSTLSLVVEEGANVEQMVKEMQNGLTGPQEIVIRSNQVLREGSIEIFDRTFAITAALRLLATIVAFIGVLSALLSLQLERAREFGVLRATGMTLGQLWQLTLVQTGLMGLVAGLLAMPTGYVLAWVLIYVINVRSFGWTLQMHLEPGYFGQALMVSLTAALLAGIYPAVRLGRMMIALTLRQE